MWKICQSILVKNFLFLTCEYPVCDHWLMIYHQKTEIHYSSIKHVWYPMLGHSALVVGVFFWDYGQSLLLFFFLLISRIPYQCWGIYQLFCKLLLSNLELIRVAETLLTWATVEHLTLDFCIIIIFFKILVKNHYIDYNWHRYFVVTNLE